MLTVGLITSLSFAGCGKDHGLRTSDFLDDDPAASGVEVAHETSPAGDGAGEVEIDPQPAADTAETGIDPGRRLLGVQVDRTYRVNAMVGQIEGRPVYANRFLIADAPALRELGSRLSRAEFEEEARRQIAVRLDAAVTNALIVGQAERELSSNERFGLKIVTEKKREALVLRWGEGSPELAETRILEATGLTLEETLREYRERELLILYTNRNFWPKVNVSRREVERYYREHYDEFNQQASRTIHFIQARTPADAKVIQTRLDAGDDFLDIASDRELNSYRASQQGKWRRPVQDPNMFGHDGLAAAIESLHAGDHSSKLDWDGFPTWVYLASAEGGRSQTLRDSQLEIEQRIRMREFQELTVAFGNKLRREGNYTSLNQMLESLVEVAMSRYAQPE